ncbi:FecR family protein [Chitinophaga polysaccharea]|uniref:FecR family protein n=1 Tax=Chitinophaga polysaccharea TaxID=1293035 RepID=A0A561PC48_9BACT|nr:FecR family protein [Chitinophaga polysaccharea]TWF35702.1 FecR family protein [Chitinophaga polysaccharea]
MMEQRKIITLLRKYAAGVLTPEENGLLRGWLEEVDADTFHKVLDESGVEEMEPAPDLEAFSARMERRLDETDRPLLRLHGWKRWTSAAAAILLLLAVGYYFAGKTNKQQETVMIAKADNQPGSNKAILKLSNGRVVPLDESTGHVFGKQTENAIIGKDSGTIEYIAGQSAPPTVAYHTLITPKGGQYKVILPDGTKVWLNAASSLYYPTAFTGAEREVVLTGEAYFEVVQQAAHPFKVKVGGIVVNVLGTSFNICAYKEEKQILTTLVDGAVKLQSNQAAVMLKPGQEANYEEGATEFTKKEVDADIAIAWTKGLFRFENDDIVTITRKIARWYDVEVQFEGKMPTRKFIGVLSRQEALSTVLKILEGTDVHFRQEGKKLIVTSKSH